MSLAVILPPPDCMRTDEPPSLEPPSFEPQRHPALHPSLDAWRANVGDPVAFDAPLIAATELLAVDVICWNVAIGLGQVETLLERLLAGDFDAGAPHGRIAPSPERPLVILLQEAFRGTDGSVPVDPGSGHHGGKSPDHPRARSGARHDVVDLARHLGMSLRYAPSMRNGAHPSDRGNAILSNVRLAGDDAFLLPFVRQRRVAVGAVIDGHAGLHFVSAHLDTHGPPPGASTFYPPGGGRAAQARALASRICASASGLTHAARPSDSPSMTGQGIVLGADLNSVLGMADPAVRALVRAGFHPARRIGSWRHTFHTPLKMLVDHILFSPGDRIEGIDVVRLDEAVSDRSRFVFGSDHHPLLAHVRLNRDRRP